MVAALLLAAITFGSFLSMIAGCLMFAHFMAHTSAPAIVIAPQIVVAVDMAGFGGLTLSLIILVSVIVKRLKEIVEQTKVAPPVVERREPRLSK